MSLHKYASKEIKNRKLYLIINTFLHVICCGLSFYFNNGAKFAIFPINSLLEFFVIHWCAWNSLLTVIYNLKEIKFLSQKDPLFLSKNKQSSFDLIVAVSNFTSLAGFTFYLPNLLKKAAIASKTWWISSIIWHYLVLPMSLIYFFKFVKPDKKFSLQQKKLFYLMLPLPIVFFLTNLVRRFILVNENYFKANNNTKFRRFAVWWFKYVEGKKHGLLLFWIIFSILYFWLMTYLLIKIKLKFFGQSSSKFYLQWKSTNRGGFIKVLKQT